MLYQPLTETEVTSPSMNLAAMICGIVGLLTCFVPFFGLAAPCLGLLFAALGRGNQMKIKGQGLAGLVMGIIGVVLNIVFTIALFVFAANYASSVVGF